MKYLDKTKSPLYRLRQSLKDISLNELSEEIKVNIAILSGIERGIYNILPKSFLENLEKAGYPFIDCFEKEYYKWIGQEDQPISRPIIWSDLTNVFE